MDLGGRPRRLYGISAEKHGPAVPYSPDVRVVMERHWNMMPEPERGGEGWLEAFCALLRVQEWQRPLFCAHLCHMFCVHHQTPAMLFSGPPGSGKTAAARLARELADPVGLEHAAAVLPKPAENLRKILAGSPVVSFDNVRRMKQGGGQHSGRRARRTGDGCRRAGGTGDGRGQAETSRMSFGNVRLVMAAPEGKPARLHSLAGKAIRYELPPVEEWKTMGNMAAEFYSMRPRLYHEMFDVLHRAFGDSQATRPTTRMADFEVLGRAIARHAGYGEKKFDEALEHAVGGDAPA